MSFPRKTDVALHLVRKPRQTVAPSSDSTPAADRAHTDLQSLTEDLAVAVNSAQSSVRNTPTPGRNQ
ncbi:MAG TPA: hypothetical protein VII58_06600 [Acidobacteriaceae bacterium]